MAAYVVTNDPFVPTQAWHIQIEKKLITACDETLIHLINFQSTNVGSEISQKIYYVYKTSVSDVELLITKKKAVFFLFANQSEWFRNIFKDENDDITTYRQFRMHHNTWNDTLPSEIAKRILTSYSITQTTASGSAYLLDHKVELLFQHFKAKIGILEPWLCDSLLKTMGYTPPKEAVANLVPFYITIKTRAEEIVAQEKIESEDNADTMNTLADARKSYELTEEENKQLKKLVEEYERELDMKIDENEMDEE